MTPAKLCRLTETEARTLIEGILWPDGPVCAHCGSDRVTRLGGKAAEKGLLKCRACRKKFTVRMGTILEDSPIPLRDWVYSFRAHVREQEGDQRASASP